MFNHDNEFGYIYSIISKFKRFLRVRKTGNIILSWLIFSIVIITLFFVIDHIFLFPSNIRLYLSILFIIYSLIFYAIILYSFFKSRGQRKIINLIQKKYNLKDDLTNVTELTNDINKYNPIGKIFIKKAYEDVSSHLKNIFKIKDFKDKSIAEKLKLLVLLLVIIAIPCFLYPKIIKTQALRFVYPYDYGERLKYLEVVPGDTQVLAGNDVEIKIITDIKKFKPYLMFKVGSGEYRKYELTKSSGSVYSFVFKNVRKDIRYYGKVAAFRSKAYNINVTELPLLGNFLIKYVFPDYTGLDETKYFASNGDIEVLPGTTVFFKATANKDLKNGFVLLDNKKRIKCSVLGNKVSGRFRVLNNQSYTVAVEDVYGFKSDEQEKYITVLHDEAPFVNILQPAYNMEIARDSIISVYYEAYDDFGISHVNFEYNVNNKTFKDERIVSNNETKSLTKIYSFDLIDISALKIGDVINFNLKVYDNAVKPNLSRSQTLNVRIRDVLGDHDVIESKLYDLFMDLAEISSNENSITNNLKNISQNITTSTWKNKASLVKNDLPSKLKNLSKFKALNQNFKKLLNDMMSDPLIEYDVYNEYMNLSSDMNYLEQMLKQSYNESDTASRMLDYDMFNKSLDNAQNLQDRVDSFLDKVKNVSENLYKQQLNSDIRNLERDVAEFRENAGREGGLGDVVGEKLFKHIENINKAMSNIGKKLSQLKMAQDKAGKQPEAGGESSSSSMMINQKTIDDTLDKMYEAMENGDIEKSLRYAESLQRELASLEKMLSKSIDSQGGGAPSKAQENVRNFKDVLQEYIDKEEDINADVTKLNKKRIEILLKKQTKGYDALLKNIRKISEDFKKNLNKIKGDFKDVKDTYYVKKLDEMLRHYVSFKGSLKGIADVQSGLKKYNEKLSSIKNMFKRSDTEILDFKLFIDKDEGKKKEREEKLRSVSQDLFNDVRSQVVALYEEMRDLSIVNIKDFSKSNQDKSKKSSVEQLNLKVEFDKFKLELEQYASESSYVDIKIVDEAYNASIKMQDAGLTLDKVNIGSAMRDVSKVLTHLYNMLERTEDMLENMSKNKQTKTTLRLSKNQRMRRKQRRGMQMQQTHTEGGYVKLPSVEFYKVPSAFREELLDSVNESAPLDYKDFIKEYYNRLSE